MIGLAQLLFTLMARTITKHTMDLTMVIYLLQSKFKKPDKECVLMFLLFDKIISANYLSTKYLFDKKIVDQKLSTKICRPKFVDQILSTKVLVDKNLSTNDMLTIFPLSSTTEAHRGFVSMNVQCEGNYLNVSYLSVLPPNWLLRKGKSLNYTF